MTMADTETDMLAVARRYHEAGLAVIPPMMDGSKRPIATWKQYQQERPTPGEIKAWYKGNQDGIGCITGAISGNLELFEFDWYDTYLAYCEVGAAAGLGDLIDRVSSAYSEATPGGGVHWYYRCETIAGNTKLAQRVKAPEEKEHPNDNIRTLIETRGEGGFSIMAPSHGKVHVKGPYTVLKGRVEDIPTITPDERQLLWNLARTFHELHVEVRSEPRSPIVDGDRPGDLFGRQASWSDILEPHGWKRIFTRGKVTHWRRPGKDIGTSATTGYTDSDTLMVFSTSTAFEPVPASYTKFAAYTLLNHKGDHGAAAKALWRDGYRGGVTVERPAPALHVDPETGELTTSRFRRVKVGEAIREGIPEPPWLVEGVFFRESTCLFYGEGGSGKTMVLLCIMLELINQGQRVLFIDEEGGIKIVGARLRDMGADPELLDKHLYYYPFTGFTDHEASQVLALVEDVWPAMVVLDSLSVALSASGVKENDNDEVTHWMNTVAVAISRHSGPTPAVVIIDHLAKNTENTKSSRGATQKKNMVDYQWYVKTIEEFDSQTIGKVRIENTKNRLGNLPEHHTFVLGGQDGRIVFERFDIAKHNSSVIPEKEMRMLERLAEGETGNAEIRAVLDVSNDTVSRYGTDLVQRGWAVRVGSGRMMKYQITAEGLSACGTTSSACGTSLDPQVYPQQPPPWRGVADKRKGADEAGKEKRQWWQDKEDDPWE